jgi:hypothetical protein
MTAPDRIYTAGTTGGMFSIEPIDVWQTEYIRADKVYKALEELKGIQAHLQAYSDNRVLMDKVEAAIKEIEG